MENQSGSKTRHAPLSLILEPVGLPEAVLKILYNPPTAEGIRPLRLWVFLYLVLAPWVWITYGLYVVQDYRVSILLYALLCCLLPSLLLSRSRQQVQFLPLNTSALKLIGIGLVLMTMLLGGWYFLADVMIDWPVFVSRISQWHLAPSHIWVFAIYFVVVNPMVEELFWRGLVYTELKYITTQKIALMLSAFFFGMWHWLLVQHFFLPAWAPVGTMTVIIGGVVFGLIYDQTKTLGAPAIVHGLGADLPIMLMLYHCISKTCGF